MPLITGNVIFTRVIVHAYNCLWPKKIVLFSVLGPEIPWSAKDSIHELVYLSSGYSGHLSAILFQSLTYNGSELGYVRQGYLNKPICFKRPDDRF